MYHPGSTGRQRGASWDRWNILESKETEASEQNSGSCPERISPAMVKGNNW